MQVVPIKPTYVPGPQRPKLEFDGLLSNFAFKFNLRRYIEDCPETPDPAAFEKDGAGAVGEALDLDALGADLAAGAYSRPLFSST